MALQRESPGVPWMEYIHHHDAADGLDTPARSPVLTRARVGFGGICRALRAVILVIGQ
jgi:hypothetical protein